PRTEATTHYGRKELLDCNADFLCSPLSAPTSRRARSCCRDLTTRLAVGDRVAPTAVDLSCDRRIAPLLQPEGEREAGETHDETNECIDDVVVRGEDDCRELGPRQEESEGADE